MLNLDQVRLLENRVGKAVARIQNLTDENTRLRSQLSGLQTRVGELEGLVRSFKDDQGRIEEGILSALDRLSAFEDSVYHLEPETLSGQQNDTTDDFHSGNNNTLEQEESEPEHKNGSTPDGQMDIF
jgi:uncharacterized phage infection (PIP) family protein YhgE